MVSRIARVGNKKRAIWLPTFTKEKKYNKKGRNYFVSVFAKAIEKF